MTGVQTNTMDGYLRRIFALMFGAVGLTAVVTYMIIWCKELQFLIMPPLYYVLLFGGLAFSIWAQVRAFSMKPATAAVMLMIYAAIMGIVITPLVAVSLSVNPMSIFYAFVLSALMFACMAMFGYKTAKNLSFLGIFLMMGMIGLILVGIASMIWPLGSTFATIVCFIGVLVFALFTAYDMQNLKIAYNTMAGGDDTSKNQLAVLGALHLYISFIAMFQYLLSLFNRD